uniref:Uncharacterized protein n=1 Tax=viral metagenome TaxID=1070528 RepID=A0A6C0LRF0_9ZZZZ
MKSIFTHRDNIDGNVGIGKLPYYLDKVLSDIGKEYINKVANKATTTHHTYYNDLTDVLKKNFDAVQYDDLWKNICDSQTNCILKHVFEMNEIYYSNPKPNFNKMNLYGAAANLIPHRDCILYNFDGIQFYRVIIGATNNNNDTITEFINFNLEQKLNRGDYMIFDFDKTLHQVKKTSQAETPRILLKMHFIVCENCKYNTFYVDFVAFFYKFYYVVARYTEQIGTDPTTFMGFFFGLLWEYPFHAAFKYIVMLLFINNIIVLNKLCDIKLNYKNTKKLVAYSIMNVIYIYLCIVSFYYGRYILFGIK